MGPIEQGTISNNRVNVFLGPNNSGKSIASRVIHGLWQLNKDDALAPGMAALFRRRAQDGRTAGSLIASTLIAKNAGINVSDVTTRGKSGGRIDVTGENNSSRFLFDKVSDPERRRLAMIMARMDVGTSRDSIYIPAGRTGTMQSLLLFMQIKNDLLNTVWEALGESPPQDTTRFPPRPSRMAHRRRRAIPEYL